MLHDIAVNVDKSNSTLVQVTVTVEESSATTKQNFIETTEETWFIDKNGVVFSLPVKTIYF